ncbi:MAG: WD40 repeat domain-containing protein, partial [Candidatus Kapaibacterium sp.]
MTTEIPTPGNKSLRLRDAKNGSFIKTLDEELDVLNTRGSYIHIPVNSAKESSFCYVKDWYHAGRFNSEIPDSAKLYSYDFQDTLRMLFSRPVSKDATYRYSDDSKDIILYDSSKAKWINAVTGAVDYVMDPYQVTDTLYSADSSLKIFRKSGHYYNVSVDQRKSGVYNEVYSQDTVPGNFTISRDWKYLFLSIYHFSEIEDQTIQLDSSMTNILSISHPVNFSEAAFSPDSKYLCRSSSTVYSDEDTITVWDLSTRTVQTQLFLHGDQKTSHYYFADSTLYIASTMGPSNPNDGPASLHKWQYPSFKDEEIVCASEIITVQGISSHSSQVLTIEANAIDIWDLASGASLIQLVRKDTDVVPLNAHFSTTGDSIFAQYADGNILVWDSHSGNILKTYPPLSDDSGAVAYFSPDCKYVCYEDGYYNPFHRLIVWDLEKNVKVSEKVFSTGFASFVFLRFSQDNKMFAFSNNDQTAIYIYNTLDCALIDSISPSAD